MLSLPFTEPGPEVAKLFPGMVEQSQGRFDPLRGDAIADPRQRIPQRQSGYVDHVGDLAAPPMAEPDARIRLRGKHHVDGPGIHPGGPGARSFWPGVIHRHTNGTAGQEVGTTEPLVLVSCALNTLQCDGSAEQGLGGLNELQLQVIFDLEHGYADPSKAGASQPAAISPNTFSALSSISSPTTRLR